MPPIQIEDLRASDSAAIAQVAALLVEALPQGWPDEASALQEVHESFEPERLSLIARGEDGAVLGWIGGISEYNGNVWELHPLAVRADLRGHGVGRALVAALESRVRALGGITITLGTDDELDQTSLAGADLYPNVWTHIAAIRNLRRHPYEFYQKLGYVIVGVIPDANGPGKPDIIMAKRVGASG